MAIKPSETNYTIPENVIVALKQANREKDAAIDSFAEANAELRQKNIQLTKAIMMMESEVAEVTRKLKEAVDLVKNGNCL